MLEKDYKKKSKYNNEGDKVDSEMIFNGFILSQDLHFIKYLYTLNV